MNLISLFNDGRKYMSICPNDKNLAFSFPEIKIIAYIKLSTRYLPPIVVALFVCQYFFHTDLIVTILTVLFALSLPIQGTIWLGKRANNPLPLNLLDWYNKTKLRLIAKQIIPLNPPEKEVLNFMSFMQLLKLAKSHLNDDDEDGDPLVK